MTRAQTTLDFAVGVSTFLVVVALVFTFTPSLLTPFTAGGSAQPVAADRAAAQLATDTLAAPAHPYRLNDSAVAAFFAANASYARDAGWLDPTTSGGFATREGYARAVLAFDERVNVSLTRADGSCPRGLSTCRIGQVPPRSSSVAVATRVVEYGGTRTDLEVRVW